MSGWRGTHIGMGCMRNKRGGANIIEIGAHSKSAHYHGYRIPDDRFRGYFGPEHGFRIYGLPFQVYGG